MTEDAAPPPPPPLSPPAALGATTIGKYIARFRYEKPQPREARVGAQRGDFWWTKSPRYARSPPPSPSTWASGDVFSFPDEDEQEEEEENEEEEGKINEKEVQIPQDGEDNDSSVDSVESKLRRRLGVWGSDSSRGGEVLTGAEPAEVLQSWGSVEWGALDLDEVEEVEEVEDVEREDPEEVIERVRRRLGWGSTTTSGAASASGLKPIDFRLSIDKREEPRRQLGRKPPLSPGSYRRGGPLEGFAARSTSSWGSTERQREFNGDEEVKSSLVQSADDREPGMREEKVEEDWQSTVVRSEETLNVSRESVSSAEGGDAKSFQTGISSLDFTDKGLRSSGSSVGSRVSRGHEPEPDQECCNDTAVPAEYSDTGAVNDQVMAHHSHELSFSDNCAAKEEQSRPFQVPELPLLQTASPARPEPALDLKSPASHASLSGRSHDSSASTRGQDKRIPAETAKTLDSLVSLVVHSWEHDFFSDPSSEEQETATIDDKHEEDGASIKEPSGGNPLSAASSPIGPSESRSDDAKGSSAVADSTTSIQGPSTVANAEEIPQLPVASDTVEEPSGSISQLDLDAEDVEDSEVPGEEEDPIVQMLLERIALLEEALRQIDS